mmetsp:Transcript_79021/g.198588  ORF Transcript_79021/g.198588 Transcript_79021/m.198588 type:complete len:209 (+) Transcript_79021:666-1292(+)
MVTVATSMEILQMISRGSSRPAPAWALQQRTRSSRARHQRVQRATTSPSTTARLRSWSARRGFVRTFSLAQAGCCCPGARSTCASRAISTRKRTGCRRARSAATPPPSFSRAPPPRRPRPQRRRLPSAPSHRRMRRRPPRHRHQRAPQRPRSTARWRRCRRRRRCRCRRRGTPRRQRRWSSSFEEELIAGRIGAGYGRQMNFFRLMVA